MSDIKTDIMVGLRYLNPDNTSKKIPSGYDCPFSRTNEDIDSYFFKFPITKGIVATVAGSGDHQLQASLYAPKEIHVFDKNAFAIQMAKLKTAGCIALPHKRFKKYFNSTSSERYNISDYKIIRDFLDLECRQFWDTMYKKGDFYKNYRRLIQPGDPSANKGKNSFEKEENFNKTKTNLEKISIYYYHSELFKFFSEIVRDKKFDSIFLSNIYDWLPLKEKEYFAEFIKTQLHRELRRNGMVAVYSPVKDCYESTGLEPSFPEAFKMNGRDKVLVYTKNK